MERHGYPAVMLQSLSAPLAGTAVPLKSCRNSGRLVKSLGFNRTPACPGECGHQSSPSGFQTFQPQPEALFLRASFAKEAGLKAGFGVPIITGKDILAVLTFFMFESREEDSHLIELVSAVTTQLYDRSFPIPAQGSRSKENFRPKVVKNIHFAGAASIPNVGWLQTEINRNRWLNFFIIFIKGEKDKKIEYSYSE